MAEQSMYKRMKQVGFIDNMTLPNNFSTTDIQETP